MQFKLPDTMRAMAISAPGGPDVLTVEQRPVPRPAPDEVLVRVAYAGVNRPDCLQRQGLYPPPANASDLPGLELSGTVVALGEGRGPEWPGHLMLGQQVCALANGGGYAEYCCVPAGQCLMVPHGLSLAEAAAMPETLFTVWHNVFQRGGVRDGEVLLVHGGTSGIGSMAVRLANLFGVKVIATCGSPAKCAATTQWGADHVIDYQTADFVAEVLALTHGRGADVVLDMVAGAYTQANLDCLAEDGRLVTIAVQGGAVAQVNVARLMVRRQTLTGSTLRPRSNEFKALLADEIAQEVWPLADEGALRPLLDSVLPLDQAAEAHRRMEAGDIIGKIVLKVAGEE